ncbi:MAG: DUF455 family protein [Opitutaceae bacterium]
MKTDSTPSTQLAHEVSPRVRGLFLKNLGDFQTELARIHAGFVPTFSIWRQRKEFPAHVFRSLRRVQDLRIRGRELGVSFQDMHVSGAVAGRALLDALCAAKNPADLLQAGIVTVHRALIAAIDDYLKNNDTIYDQPSVALLEADRDELAAQVKWAEAALVELARDAAQTPDPTFAKAIERHSALLAPALREHAVRGFEPLRIGRRIGVLPLGDSVLPRGFRHLEFGPDPMPKENSYAHRERYHAVNFLQEVQATDSCAAILFEAPDMPWDFYFDLARHMWDEARHSIFGEKKLEALGTTAAAAGLSSKAYAMRQTLTPLDRYAALSTQEADAFPGKHAGLKDAIAHGDSVSAMAWSYDIADETQHVRFGAKWIPVMIEKMGEARSTEQVRADSENWRVSVLAEVYKPAAATLR